MTKVIECAACGILDEVPHSLWVPDGWAAWVEGLAGGGIKRWFLCHRFRCQTEFPRMLNALVVESQRP